MAYPLKDLIDIDHFQTKGPDGVASLVLSGPLLSSRRWIEDQKAHIQALPDEIQDIIQKSEETKDFGSPQFEKPEEYLQVVSDFLYQVEKKGTLP
jgi:hypothetical protein